MSVKLIKSKTYFSIRIMAKVLSLFCITSPYKLIDTMPSIIMLDMLKKASDIRSIIAVDEYSVIELVVAFSGAMPAYQCIIYR